MRRLLIIPVLLCVLGPHAVAQQLTAGEAKIETGQRRGLWTRAMLNGVAYSDFAQPEEGKPLDLTRSKTAEIAAKVNVLTADAPGLRKGEIKIKTTAVPLRASVP